MLLSSYAGKAFGISLLSIALLRFIPNLTWTARYVFAAICFCSALMLFVRAGRVRFVDAMLMTRHLNRTVPEFEESCQLLLKADAEMTVLEKLQQRRVQEAWVNRRQPFDLPTHALRSAWMVSAMTTLVAALVFAVPSFFAKQNRQAPIAVYALDSAPRPVALQVKTVQVEIFPPAYTGKPSHQSGQFDLTVEENAEVRWKVQTNQRAKHAALLFSDGDTLVLNSAGEMRYGARRRINDRSFYHAEFATEANQLFQTDFFKIEVKMDLPPSFTVINLPLRTEIAPGQRALLDLHAKIEDDYAVAGAEIIATLARGSGEAVRFREITLEWDSIHRRSAPLWELERELDLAALGMTPGDELYFYLQAADNRQPEANRSRSETFFVVIQDTAAQQLSDEARLAVNPLPDYFRSQRQIIIDTEKLIREQPQLSEAAFRNRSNNIGLDQQALRFRYSQFLGDEVSGEFVQSIEGPPDEHEESSEPSLEGQETRPPSAVPGEFIHSHDSAENATLFSESIKSQLQAALAEMWEAELRLRTYKPNEALPFEYRALKLLKDVQQRSRVYVQRIGYEPAPIEIAEKRLTGDLASVANRTMGKNETHLKSFARLRDALRVLHSLKTTPYAPSADAAFVLEKSVEELTSQLGKTIEPTASRLRVLRDLRRLIDEVSHQQKLCQECLIAAEREFWKILPSEESAPAGRPLLSSSLAGRYFEKIGRRP
jgi:hypothetical protein